MAVSPDGSQIVYVANAQLYLRTLDDMEARPIQGTDEDPASPFFSPDGEWVGYYSTSDNKLKKIAPIGGAPVTLCDATIPFGVSWGSDDTIVYGQPEGIMRVSANGGTPELVIPTEAPELVHGPQMLPGGEWVLFTLSGAVAGLARWDEAQIVVQSLETGERKVLWEGGSDARYLPTGHLVYALEDVLFALPFDLASLEVSGGSVPMVEGVRRVSTGTTATANYGFSDRGTLVYVAESATADRRILALVDRNGVAEPLNLPPGLYAQPRLSPSGTQVTYQTPDDAGTIIWVYDLSGTSAPQRLTYVGDNRRPIWTPDGKRVTFASVRDGIQGIHWKRADLSGDAERLTTADEGTEHLPDSWSPDGKTLSFEMLTTTERGMWTFSLDDRETVVFMDQPSAHEWGSAFSPDGKWLAYHSNETGVYDVYVQQYPSGPKQQISFEQGRWPLWSHGGGQLFYRLLPEYRTLKAISISAEPAFNFTNPETFPLPGFVTDSGMRSFDITPDDERFVMVLAPGQSELPSPQINIILNWFEELKARVPTN